MVISSSITSDIIQECVHKGIYNTRYQSVGEIGQL